LDETRISFHARDAANPFKEGTGVGFVNCKIDGKIPFIRIVDDHQRMNRGAGSKFACIVEGRLSNDGSEKEYEI
jgi:hypothetical protein